MSGFVTPNTPNLADFRTFLATTVQIPAVALPAGSPWPGYAFDQAMAWILTPPNPPGILYALAAYNGATHILIEITPDQTGSKYFANACGAAGYGLITPPIGMIATAGDESTSQSVEVPEFAKGLQFQDLQMMKTPYGRRFLAWQQSYGPTVWGVT